MTDISFNTWMQIWWNSGPAKLTILKAKCPKLIVLQPLQSDCSALFILTIEYNYRTVPYHEPLIPCSQREGGNCYNIQAIYICLSESSADTASTTPSANFKLNSYWTLHSGWRSSRPRASLESQVCVRCINQSCFRVNCNPMYRHH